MKKHFGLYTKDDNYVFDYISPAPTIDLNDTTSAPLTEEVSIIEAPPADNISDPLSDTTYMESPLWMNPAPPPIIEGPVIRFSRVTLNLVTAYDSVFIKNTTGVLSLRSNVFVGEEGII